MDDALDTLDPLTTGLPHDADVSIMRFAVNADVVRVYQQHPRYRVRQPREKASGRVAVGMDTRGLEPAPAGPFLVPLATPAGTSRLVTSAGATAATVWAYSLSLPVVTSCLSKAAWSLAAWNYCRTRTFSWWSGLRT